MSLSPTTENIDPSIALESSNSGVSIINNGSSVNIDGNADADAGANADRDGNSHGDNIGTGTGIGTGKGNGSGKEDADANADFEEPNNSPANINPNLKKDGSENENESENPLFTLANSVPDSKGNSWQPNMNLQMANAIAQATGNLGQISNMQQIQLLAQAISEQNLQDQHNQNDSNNHHHHHHHQEDIDFIDQNYQNFHPQLQLQINQINQLPQVQLDEIQKRLFVCDHPGCGKTFSRKMNLMSHFHSTHEHKKPYQCSICDKSFARHSDRRRHEKSQHIDQVETGDEINIKKFTCGGVLDDGTTWGCGKVFKRKDGLTAHWKSAKAKRKCFRGLNAQK
ncbi:hypothetical protein DAMA08_018470 [Martiniozyma asiatica (nom. inval.)]|nr:hypothetical protein DAMA08_018470 [Martiniozyma asiatica]